MRTFCLSSQVELISCAGERSRCYRYARSELVRLLGRLGVSARLRTARWNGGWLRLSVVVPGAEPPAGRPRDRLSADGFAREVDGKGVTLWAPSAKGILNAVYELAEALGFLFLLPGEAGEWPPEQGAWPLPLGRKTFRPRFPWRGVIWESLDTRDYTHAEWLRFYAKLRFNAVLHEIADRPLAEELGLRLEAGGHGMSKLLPRELFAKKPELFRMSQPEDFGGKRNPDFNFCVTNPEAKAIVQARFEKEAKKAEGLYALNLYADDLPGGGWCHCPSCRSLSPSDQVALVARHMAEVVRRLKQPLRFSLLAYHDSLKPGETVSPPPESFLLYAPRERCYGHALNDPACRRNRLYAAGLEAWRKNPAIRTDAHTCEYYFDQILFRGLYPFLPNIIRGDLEAYRQAGIECPLSLQVGGPAIAPEYNMLFYARALWDAALTPEAFAADLSERIMPGRSGVWERFLTSRAAIFENAMRLCELSENGWMDYRWLPETTEPFGREMARVYAASAAALEEAARRLAVAAAPGLSGRAQELIRREVGRARFEAAEFRVMSAQQRAMNELGAFLSSGDRRACRRGIAALAQAVKASALAERRAVKAGVPAGSWYYGNINAWLRREFQRKAALYAGYLAKTQPVRLGTRKARGRWKDNGYT